MKEKKTPERMCIACRQIRDKRELIRIVKSPDGEISLDFTGKKNGRGAYICNSAECIAKCRKAKLLNKTFGMPVDDGVYAKISEEFDGGNG